MEESAEITNKDKTAEQEKKVLSPKNSKKVTSRTTKEKKVVSSKKKSKTTTSSNKGAKLIYPKQPISKILRLPQAIIDQNAGKECTPKEVAQYLGIGLNGPFHVEISSAKKYNLLESTGTSKIKPTELAKKILRPQSHDDELNGIREAVINAPVIGDVYKHYRGENLPDHKFFENTLIDTFSIPKDKVNEFANVFTESLTYAKLFEKIGDKVRVLDVSSPNLNDISSEGKIDIKKGSSKAPTINTGDSCFVIMPFAPPLGEYYSQIFEPAINKAGLTAIRADNDIFGTGKIIDQIWTGINKAKVLIAELTQRNPNVYYELGIAHALKKPVVLVCSNEEDVPFDLKHIRVIYYNIYDPFWGTKLIDKVAENIISAIKNPEETILFE